MPLLLAPLLATTAFVLRSPGSTQPIAALSPILTRRVTVPSACDNNNPRRDPEVERATGGGWSSLFPNPNAFIFIVGIGLFSYFFSDTPVGQWLNEPMLKQVAVEQQVDDAGTAFGPTTEMQATGGLGLILAYNLAGQFIRPRLEKRARARAKREAQAEEARKQQEARSAAKLDPDDGMPPPPPPST